MFHLGFEKVAGFKPEKIRAALRSRAEKNIRTLSEHSATAGKIHRKELERIMKFPSLRNPKTRADLAFAKMSLKSVGQKNLGRKK